MMIFIKKILISKENIQIRSEIETDDLEFLLLICLTDIFFSWVILALEITSTSLFIIGYYTYFLWAANKAINY